MFTGLADLRPPEGSGAKAKNLPCHPDGATVETLVLTTPRPVVATFNF
ncbi:MAG TPA: hypothetical protein VIT65_12385 [Microlunatus sp.]